MLPLRDFERGLPAYPGWVVRDDQWLRLWGPNPGKSDGLRHGANAEMNECIITWLDP